MPKVDHAQIHELYMDGMPILVIARTGGNSPATVRASIKRAGLPKVPRKNRACYRAAGRKRLARRCIGCGGMVSIWPCLACQISTAQRQPQPARAAT